MSTNELPPLPEEVIEGIYERVQPANMGWNRFKALLGEVRAALASAQPSAEYERKIAADALRMQIRTLRLSGRNDGLVFDMERAADMLSATPPAQTPAPTAEPVAQGKGAEPGFVLVKAYSECGMYVDDAPGTRADCAAKIRAGNPCERCPSRASPSTAGDAQVARDAVLDEVAAEFDRRANPAVGFYEPHEPAEIVRAMKEPHQ